MDPKQIGEKKIFDITNNGTDSYFGYTKLLWVKNHEQENWQKIRWVLPANSYIVYRMTGELMVDYSSAGNFGGIYDYNKHCWSEEMCELWEFHRSLCRKDSVSRTIWLGIFRRNIAKCWD